MSGCKVKVKYLGEEKEVWVPHAYALTTKGAHRCIVCNDLRPKGISEGPAK